MARKDALLRLHKRLLAQRDDLRRKLELPAASLSDQNTGDAADLAAHDVERELESQLVSLETRELARIERAIQAMRNGTYGQCEVCSNRIPVARLQALPHTPCCVNCQRQYEEQSADSNSEPDWESAWEFQARENDRELTLRDIRIDAD